MEIKTMQLTPLEKARLAPKGSQRRSNTIRTKDGGFTTIKYSRKDAIYLCCMECLGWDTHPKDCTSPHCPLFPFRGATMKSQHGDKEHRHEHSE